MNIYIYIYIYVYVYNEDLSLNSLQGLTGPKTLPNQIIYI